MEIPPKPAQGSPLLTPTRPSSSGLDLSFLKPGQTLTAEVVTPHHDGMTLKVDGRLLRVVSELQLASGTRINIQVEEKAGSLELRLLGTPPQDSPQQSLLRQILPKQQPLLPFIAQLARLTAQLNLLQTDNSPSATMPATTRSALNALGALITANNLLQSQATAPDASAGQATRLTPLLQQAITSLVQQLPTTEKLATPEGIKQAIADSGMFFESRLILGEAKGPLQSDLKSLLFRIAFLLRQSLESPPLATQRPPATTAAKPDKTASNQPAPPQLQIRGDSRQEFITLLQQLGRQSESALARIQMNQLSTLIAREGGDDAGLILELPLFTPKQSEQLGLRIQRETRQHEGKNETCWSVTLTLDSEADGAIRAVVSLMSETVSTTFWCERPETQRRFQQHLDELRERLQQRGLVPGRTQALNGLPPEPDSTAAPFGNHSLINLKA